MVSKAVFIFGVVVLCAALHSVVCHPAADNDFDNEAVDGLAENIRSKRASCSSEYGCWKGKCWAGCTALTILSGTKGEWCYTTKGASLIGKKVPCTKDADCYHCWNCAGVCFAI